MTHHYSEVEDIINDVFSNSVTRGLQRLEQKQIQDQIKKSRDLLFSLGGDASEVDIKPHPKGGIFACFPHPPSTVVQVTSRSLQLRWFYQVEDNSFFSVPHSSTEWVLNLLFENNVIAPSFAPTFVDGTKTLGPKGRARTTKKLLEVQTLCNGMFQTSGDFYKCFACSWRDGPRHSCPAKLFIVGCSKQLTTKQEFVKLNCVYSDGCQHHLDDPDRGRSRTNTINSNSALTPKGVCRNVVRRTHPHALWAGNKSFGPVNTQAARKALSRQRMQNYANGEDDVTSIKLAQEELSSEDFLNDKFERNLFYGSIHELLLTNTGDLRSVSIYCDLGISTFAKLVEEKPDTTAVIDCTGSLVRDVWISRSSDMAQRSRKGRSKKPKAASKDGKKLLYDVLNFHLAVKLRSGTFVPIEAVIVQRNAYTFIDILTGFKRRLRQASGTGRGEHIKYFVCDMAPPFTIAVVYVFNQGMSLPEYLVTRIFALKCGAMPILRCTIVWCSAHAERAMRNFARDKFKTREKRLLNDMEWLFRSIHLALCRTKTYEELCEMIGFIDFFLSTGFFPAVGEKQRSKSMRLKSSDELFSSGEKLLWHSFGGVPDCRSYDSLQMVQARSVQNKGYNPTHVEDAYNLEQLKKRFQNQKEEEDTKSRGEEMKAINLEQNASNHELVPCEEFKDIAGGEHGVVKIICGSYDVYVAFRQLGNIASRARYRIYIPSLAGRNEKIGGFSVWLKAFTENGKILNECFLDGTSREYVKKNWYPHLALLCPVLTGTVPVTHNTTVEVSFKTKKHHEDLGLLAKQRMGGMRVSEYVKRAAREATIEARRVRILLESLPKDDLNPQRSKKRQITIAPNVGPSKTRKSFVEEIKKTNTIKANSALDVRLFVPKKPLSAVQERKDATEPNREIDISAAQQSQSEACQIEEGWASSKKLKRERDETALLELMRRKREDYFGDWKQADISSFLTKYKMRIDRSAISRIFTEKNNPSAPGKDKCEILREIFHNLLPKRTVDDEQKVVGFNLLPVSVNRVHNIINNPTEKEMEIDVISSIEDAYIKLEDLRRLVRPEKWSGTESRFWVSDEVVNGMTSLYSIMETSGRIFFLTLL